MRTRRCGAGSRSTPGPEGAPFAAWHTATGTAGRQNAGVASQNRTRYQDCLAEARRLADAGKGREAAAAHRIHALAQVILAGEAARAAWEELAETLRVAAVSPLSVADIAAAARKSHSWIRRVVDS